MAVLARLGLTAVLVLTATLRLWRLSQNGYGNDYYSAAVRSMTASWHNFLYAAFDPAGFVSVDKPPVALWVQVASVKLFGFHGLSVLGPQVLEDVAAPAASFTSITSRRWRLHSPRSPPSASYARGIGSHEADGTRPFCPPRSCSRPRGRSTSKRARSAEHWRREAG